MAKTFNIPLLRTTIRTGVDLTKAQILRRDMIRYAPKSKAVQDYQRLLDELFERGVL